MFSSSACCAQRCSSCSSALASNLGTFTNWTSTFQKRLEKSNTKVNYGHYVSVHIRTYRYTLSGHKMSFTSIKIARVRRKLGNFETSSELLEAVHTLFGRALQPQQLPAEPALTAGSLQHGANSLVVPGSAALPVKSSQIQ